MDMFTDMPTCMYAYAYTYHIRSVRAIEVNI